MRLTIHTQCTGQCRQFDFNVELHTEVRQLKQLLAERVRNLTTISDTDLANSYFVYEGNIINCDNDQLKLYGVEDASILQHIEVGMGETRGGGALGQLGMKFLDVSNDNGLRRQLWSRSAPIWRRVNAGFVIEGKCLTPNCKAEGQMVTISMNYRTFDMISDPDIDKVVCPMCKQYVEPQNCGFNNCWWRYSGMKKVDGQRPQSCQSDWKQADNAYHYFDQTESGTATWLRLNIEAVKNKPV